MSTISTVSIDSDFPLNELNTFRVSACASAFVRIDGLEQLPELAVVAASFSERMILGGGSNVLFAADFDGLVIYPQLTGIRILEETTQNIKIEVAASENWHDFVAYCVKKGYFGIENLALIPGTVGAAPVQNIGAYGVEIGDFIDTVNCFDLRTSETVAFINEECNFAYRDSFFKQQGQGNILVTSVELTLNKKANCVLTYKPLKEFFHEKVTNNESPTVQITPLNVFNRVCQIRQEKLPDPALIANAGSFFKNPIISQTQYSKLKHRYPDIVVYPIESDGIASYKVAAGWLIEQAGFKGKHYGKVGVYEKQALVLVNHSDSDGGNIYRLAIKIVNEIKSLFDIELEPEVRIFPRHKTARLTEE